MQNNKSHINSTIYFSRWSRKSYAIFSGLGKYIKISRLSVDICGKAVLKLNKHAILMLKKLDSSIYEIQAILLNDIDVDLSEDNHFLEMQIRKETIPCCEDSFLYYILKIFKGNSDNSVLPFVL